MRTAEIALYVLWIEGVQKVEDAYARPEASFLPGHRKRELLRHLEVEGFIHREPPGPMAGADDVSVLIDHGIGEAAP